MYIHVQYTQTESICLRHSTIRLDSHVTSWLNSHGVASRKSTSGMSNQQKGKQFALIRRSRVHELIFGLSNRKYQRRIDTSWVYNGQPSKCKDWKQVILLSITKVTYTAVPGVQLIVNETIFLFGSSDMLVQSHQTFLYSWWLGFF